MKKTIASQAGNGRIIAIVALALLLPATIFALKLNADNRSKASGSVVTAPISQPCQGLFCDELGAELIFPKAGTQLASTNGFQWSPAAGAQEYILSIGAKIDPNKQYYNKSQGLNTSVKVTNLPTDGSQVVVNLTTKFAQATTARSYLFQAAGKTQATTATINSPEPHSVLPNTKTFAWTSVPHAQEYRLQIGTAPGVFNIYDQSQGVNTSVKVTNLVQTPNPARKVFVRLSTRLNNAWTYVEYTYTI